MRRFIWFSVMMAVLLGCSTTKTAREGEQPDPKKDAMKVLSQDMSRASSPGAQDDIYRLPKPLSGPSGSIVILMAKTGPLLRLLPAT
jgi:hypothetical protein